MPATIRIEKNIQNADTMRKLIEVIIKMPSRRRWGRRRKGEGNRSSADEEVVPERKSWTIPLKKGKR